MVEKESPATNELEQDNESTIPVTSINTRGIMIIDFKNPPPGIRLLGKLPEAYSYYLNDSLGIENMTDEQISNAI